MAVRSVDFEVAYIYGRAAFDYVPFYGGESAFADLLSRYHTRSEFIRVYEVDQIVYHVEVAGDETAHFRVGRIARHIVHVIEHQPFFKRKFVLAVTKSVISHAALGYA